MIEFDAVYYDGRTSARKAARVQAYTQSLYVTGEGGFKLEVPLANVRVEPPLAGTRRILQLPGGAQLQTDADAALRALFPRSNRLETWVHALESRWPLALAGVVVAAAFSWWCVVYGLPLAAGLVATHVPVQVEVKLGEQTLASIDEAVCDKSDIGLANQDKVMQDLAARGIIVALRPLGLRLSPHFYNTEADVARLLDALPG